jgi:transketolase
MTTEHSPFQIGQANVLWDTDETEVAIFATGPLVYNALKAAKALEREIPVSVINVHTIKPLDSATVLAAVEEAGAAVTVEEHQITGGLGSAVAELLAKEFPAPIEFIGVKDRFGQSGEPEELIEYYGMGVSHIVAAVRRAKERKHAKRN